MEKADNLYLRKKEWRKEGGKGEGRKGEREEGKKSNVTDFFKGRKYKYCPFLGKKPGWPPSYY